MAIPYPTHVTVGRVRPTVAGFRSFSWCCAPHSGEIARALLHKKRPFSDEGVALSGRSNRSLEVVDGAVRGRGGEWRGGTFQQSFVWPPSSSTPSANPIIPTPANNESIYYVSGMRFDL